MITFKQIKDNGITRADIAHLGKRNGRGSKIFMGDTTPITFIHTNQDLKLLVRLRMDELGCETKDISYYLGIQKFLIESWLNGQMKEKRIAATQIIRVAEFLGISLKLSVSVQ